MNIKNSKFFKRIQQLRHVSKEKMRKKKEREREHERERERELLLALHEKAGEELLKINNRNNKTNKRDSSITDFESSKGNPEGFDLNSKSPSGERRFKKEISTPNDAKAVFTRLHEDPNFDIIHHNKGSICVNHSHYPMIGKIAKAMGFRVVKETKMWNILWTDSFPSVEICKNMKRFQQSNHFPGMMEICRKDLLSRNLNRMLKLYPRHYKIFPKTWIFPADYGDALNYSNHKSRNKTKQRTFILKPDAGAQGRGIWLTNDLRNINPHDRMICQTYIARPLLIDGYKFDLRVYTLVTSVDPLRVFVYNEGLARFATSKYTEPAQDNTTDLFMHLTNYSVNKRSSQYELCDDDDCGSKRKLSAINNWMKSHGYSVSEFWAKIDDIIIKVLLSALPILKHNYHACFPSHDKIQACFEILGFDVLVDSKMRPYILEVNHSPSFHMNEQVDKEVKRALIRDTLALVGTLLVDKKQILKEDRKRVKQRLLKKSRVETPSNYSNILEKKELKNKNQELSNKSSKNSSTSSHGKSSSNSNKSLKDMSQPLAQQIAWEETHMGNFRRIMPPQDPDLEQYYSQFFGHENTASIFGKTAVSIKREALAKKLRIQLEEKRHKEQELLQQAGTRFEERQRKRATMSRAVIEKRRVTMYRNMENWTPGFITDAEERLRHSWIQMRTDLLRNMRILETVYESLYRAGSLSDADILNYPNFYKSLERGEMITGN